MNIIKFATAIICVDEWVQNPVVEYLKNKFKVDYVDMIAEPAPDKFLSENEDTAMINSIKKRAMISVEKHKSKLIAIAGHYNCLGKKTDKETQLIQIIYAINTVKFWNLNAKVIGLWADGNGQVHQV